MTTSVPYTPTIIFDGLDGERAFLSITAAPEYQDKSFEELRLEDHLARARPTGRVRTARRTSSDRKMSALDKKRSKENNAGNITASAFGSSSPTPSSLFGSQVGVAKSASTGFSLGSSGDAPKAGGFSFGGASSTTPTAAFSFTFASPPNNESKSSTASAFSSGGTSTPTPNGQSAGNLEKAATRRKVVRASLRKNRPSDSLEGYEHYRSFMDKLAESGVDDYVDLPMIAVMGDTSSGKSSLLSNISLIELPSSSTLTTRCPIRLQMRNAKSKEARVKVVWKDKPKGTDVDFAERLIGEDNWSSITEAIEEAQAHIIDKTKKQVARDVVCVDVKSPHCENLTLVDLPGIVRTTGQGESSTIAGDIQSVMNDYLWNERCVILAVHPSNVDFHNSQILAEAKKVDPKTRRTIPVLTKPDLIDEGAETSVKELLLGEKTDHFEMGFHMIKGRGQKDLNEDVAIEDGLEKEEAFFRNTQPWRDVADQTKFGTRNLRAKLAELQMKLIHKSFDLIISEMKEKRDAAASELKALGDIPSTLREKRTLFRTVRDELREGLGSESLNGRLTQLHSNGDMRPSAEFHSASSLFHKELNQSKLANIASIQVGTQVIAVKNGKELRGIVTRFDDAKDKVIIQKKLGNTGFVLGDTESTKVSRNLVRSDPQWISDLIEKNRAYCLPIFLDPDLFGAIVANQMEKEWKKPSLNLLDATAKLMERASKQFIQGMAIKSLPTFVDYLVRKTSEVIELIKNDAKEEVLRFIEREKIPYTQNHYLFENLSKLRTQRLMDEVLSSVASHSKSDNKDSDALSSAIQDIFERNQKRSVPDHMAEEMQHALDSYGKVALKRFVDTVPMICAQIMQRFPRMVEDILSDVVDSDIEGLVVAPQGAIDKMDELKKEIETLEKGIDTVTGLSASL